MARPEGPRAWTRSCARYGTRLGRLLESGDKLVQLLLRSHAERGQHLARDLILVDQVSTGGGALMVCRWFLDATSSAETSGEGSARAASAGSRPSPGARRRHRGPRRGGALVAPGAVAEDRPRPTSPGAGLDGSAPPMTGRVGREARPADHRRPAPRTMAAASRAVAWRDRAGGPGPSVAGHTENRHPLGAGRSGPGSWSGRRRRRHSRAAAASRRWGCRGGPSEHPTARPRHPARLGPDQSRRATRPAGPLDGRDSMADCSSLGGAGFDVRLGRGGRSVCREASADGRR